MFVKEFCLMGFSVGSGKIKIIGKCGDVSQKCDARFIFNASVGSALTDKIRDRMA
jgi:hypothetical protein